MQPLIISIDGPAASGKTTVGCLLAMRLGYLFFDTGILYRAVTLLALERGLSISDQDGVTRLAQEVQIDLRPPSAKSDQPYTVLAENRDITEAIRQPIVDANVSPVSAYAGVRGAMLELQRRIGRRGQVVVVGRDIGTVVLPEADFKLYLDASLEERARRRYQERLGRGETVDFDTVKRNLEDRDRTDSSRSVAPLRQAQDAAYLDSTGLTVAEVLERVMEQMTARAPC